MRGEGLDKHASSPHIEVVEAQSNTLMPDELDVERVRIRALVMDPVSSVPVVVLEGQDSGKLLPIWIGLCEANAITLSMEQVVTPRPMTHDLLVSILEASGRTLERVVIHSLENNVFHATLHLMDRSGKVTTTVDSRPSDALALAVRTDSPVFVAREVLHTAAFEERSESEVVRAILEKLRPEDLGHWEM